jgi:hypothetical protein
MSRVVDDHALLAFLRALASDHGTDATALLSSAPELATVALVAEGATRATAEQFFLHECGVYVYAGHTALHVGAAAYNTAFARQLVSAGADVRAKNRRGAEPLHEATSGGPGSYAWDPARQAAVIAYLIEVGADPNAGAAGGVTPLHRAVRNRCAAAVRALLDAGADPHRRNDRGSTAITLASQTTGRGGSGSPEAKAQQVEILALLSR